MHRGTLDACDISAVYVRKNFGELHRIHCTQLLVAVREGLTTWALALDVLPRILKLNEAAIHIMLDRNLT